MQYDRRHIEALKPKEAPLRLPFKKELIILLITLVVIVSLIG